MFDIPDNYMDSFLNAWKEEYEGFDLSWEQFEVLRWGMNSQSIGELREKLASMHSQFNKMHPSNFYRIVNDLIDKGYVEQIEIDGRSKIIQTSQKGAQEIGRLGRYIFELQMKRIKKQLWRNLVHYIHSSIGCLLDPDKRIIVVAAEYEIIPGLIEICRNCPNPIEDLPEDDVKLQSQFIFLNYGADLSVKTESSQVINTDKIDDWPFKDDYADIILEFNTINTFYETNIVKESIRCLKPDGNLIFFELVKETSPIAKMMLREVSMLLNIKLPESDWKIREQPISIESLKSKLDTEELETVEFSQDIITSKIIAKKSNLS